jgi:multidrug efflux pump
VKSCQDCRTSGVSQILTLYTTPVIYLLIDRLRRRSEPAALAAAAE